MPYNMRELSKEQLNFDGRTIEAINCGSLQRIADATELMAKRYSELIAERDQFKRWWEQERASAVSLGHVIRSLKGANTKLRERLDAGRDLYEALKGLAPFCREENMEGESDWERAWLKAEAAIAKAEGKESR